MSTIRIASVQLCSHHDIDVNMQIIAQAVAKAAGEGARLVVLPENACLMGSQRHAAKRFEELHRALAKLAKVHGVFLVAGTLPCPERPDNTEVPCDKFRQVSVLFDDQGQALARYDKLHLFRATVGDGVGDYDEGRTFEAGDRLVVVPCVMDGVMVHVGMMVCFDLRFPRLAQTLRQMGADILTAPAAFTFKTGQAHWQLLLQARALDAQCLVVGAAQGGSHDVGKGRTRDTWGHSMIVDAHGRILASTDKTNVDDAGFEVVYADFDKITQSQIRQDMPIFNCPRLA